MLYGLSVNHSPLEELHVRTGRSLLVLARLLLPAVLLATGLNCAEDSQPRQRVVAERRAERADERAAEAEQRVEHARRLRDVERLRYEAGASAQSAQLAALRGVLVACVGLILAETLWLVIEIRQRRVLQAALSAMTRGDRFEASFPAADGGDSAPAT